MSDDPLEGVLSRLETGTNGWSPPGDPASGSTGAVVLSCSMGSGHEQPLWPVDRTGAVTAVTSLGNQALVRAAGERVVSDGVAGLASDPDVEAVVVVGHTECTVLADAYDRYVGRSEADPPGIDARLDPLVELVSEAVAAGVLDTGAPPRTTRYRLVEYNVVRQVEALSTALAPETTVAGYVHDEDGAYSSFPGKHYLVTVDGRTDDESLRSRLPDDASPAVASLLS